MCIAVISDLCDDVVKYVRGGDTDITFGRLVFFSDAESNSHRRDYWLDWPCQRLTILRVSRSKLTERNSIRTQSNWRLRSNLSSPPLSLRRPPPHCFPFYLFIFFFFSLLAYGSFLSLLSPILFCTRRDFQLGEKKKWRNLLRNVVPFFVGERDKLPRL